MTAAVMGMMQRCGTAPAIACTGPVYRSIICIAYIGVTPIELVRVRCLPEREFGPYINWHHAHERVICMDAISKVNTGVADSHDREHGQYCWTGVSGRVSR